MKEWDFKNKNNKYQRKKEGKYILLTIEHKLNLGEKKTKIFYNKRGKENSLK